MKATAPLDGRVLLTQPKEEFDAAGQPRTARTTQNFYAKPWLRAALTRQCLDNA